MFGKFTDRARKVMAFADQEAQRLNHEYIGTEHFLLGIINEGSGVGATVLKSYDLNIKILREEVEKLVKRGPDTINRGKRPQTPRAKHVIELAIEYARSLNHNYVGTEHILGGLVAEEEGIASQVLLDKGFDEKRVKEDLENLLGVSRKSKEVQKTGKPGDYWRIPRKDMNLVTFLETCYSYNISGVREDNKPLDISVKDLDTQVVSYIKVGRLDLTSEDSIEHKGACVVYNIDKKDQMTEEDIRQIGFALNLKGIFDDNYINYKEEPPCLEVLKALKKPKKEIASLIDRFENRV